MLRLVAVASVVAVAISACAGDPDRARAGAIDTLVTSRQSAEACFQRFVGKFPGDQDFTDYLATIDSPDCGSTEILNKTDAELERFWQYRGEWMPFKSREPGTWYTSSAQSGNTVEVAVTTVGRGDGTSNDNLPVLASAAVCWTLVVDLTSKTAQTLDEGTCHDALVQPGTDILDWDDALVEYESLAD